VEVDVLAETRVERAVMMTAFRRIMRFLAKSMLVLTGAVPLLAGLLSVAEAQPAPAPASPGASAPAPPLNVDILYIGRQYDEPPPLSLLDKIVTDQGIQGARIALQEDAQTGRFVNQTYHLSEMILPLDADFKAKASAALKTHKLIIADLEKDDLLALADMPDAKDAIIFDIRTSDDALRQEQCRANVFHFLPSTSMRTDALAQYLVWKHWPNWLLVSGKNPADLAYADDVKQSARKFGAKVVDERFYTYAAGSRRTDTGHQQVQQQLPLVTQNAPAYDVVFVADESQVFGEYMPYRTWDPRPVVGTAGLIAVAWHRSFEEYGGTQLQNRFEREVGRIMTERDYSAWLGIRAYGEAILRSNTVQPAALRAYLLSDKFGVAGYKDEAMNFRLWDLQLRQPIILASARDLVSVSPQDGFLNPNYLTDTLGFDKPESKCHFQ
jgi:ABC transporter substrate binding protein (PQQ-dependent alcohol dehydrogenase system)